MANMCHNWVEIEPCEGAEEEVKELFKLLGKEFNFNKVIPVEKDKDCKDEWGCSSIAFDVDYHEQCEDHHEWYFWTKWVPARGIFEAIEKKFPNVFIVWRYEQRAENLYGYLNKEYE